MKKTLLLGILGLAASALSTYGQGVIVLDNYDSYGPYVTYGDSVSFANGTSGAKGALGANVGPGSWTVQAYFASGSVSIPLDPSHIADPGSLGLTAGTGPGSTAGLNDAHAAHAGAFLGNFWGIPGSSAAGGQTYTLEVAVYNGASYASSSIVGHSEAFTMTTSANSSTTPNITGNAMPAFSIFTVPEPSVFALSSMGAAALMLIRRKK